MRVTLLTFPEHNILVPGCMHVSFVDLHSQALPFHSGLHANFPQSHFPLPEHNLLSRRSQEKFSH